MRIPAKLRQSADLWRLIGVILLVAIIIAFAWQYLLGVLVLATVLYALNEWVFGS